MRTVLNSVEICEVPASGEFCLSEGVIALFPAAIYGFAARFTEFEKLELFEEAQRRGLCSLNSINAFKPIEDDLYPIYWGKDKQLGARPYEHLGNPDGTGAIRLSTYMALRGKTISCATLVVVDNSNAELAIQRAFPHLLKTSTKKHIGTECRLEEN